MNITLNSLENAKNILLNLEERESYPLNVWTPYMIFVHCSKTIEFSISGYPSVKPTIIQNTVGKVVFHKFIKQGYMKHNLQADVAGSAPIEETGSFQQGRDILIKSIDKFGLYSRELKPHLLFGKLNKKEYDTYFAMHIADHLSKL